MAENVDTTEVAAGPPVARQSSSTVLLESLAPRYDEKQHSTYLNRLEEAAQNPKNRNVALTGRYGAGKSSVLDKFEEKHKSATLRLAISTLGPNPESVSLTNRIQKELVKQLVYSASPHALRYSHFSRISHLSTWRAIGESTAAVGVVGTLLILLDWLPSLASPSLGSIQLPDPLAWTLFTTLVVFATVVVRRMSHNRFSVTDVSAAGASIRLTKRTSTYFDEYLDEIVHYFDHEGFENVIFEDLDRFDDPQIFEALRELNTILNNTPRRAKKDQPLRFIYAVKDSLFEKLGADTNSEADDAAAAEMVRANRTKFFDLVIPIVPFISHKNARELLAELLDGAGISDIDRGLVDLVAQHTTDMRLQRNIRNEYLVFSERLLESTSRAPGLTSTKLFALVAYKNFHLEDFEKIARRCSDLDCLYVNRRKLVRSSVAELEKRKRYLVRAELRGRSKSDLANRLGERLRASAELLKDSPSYVNLRYLRFAVESETFMPNELSNYEFWAAVARVGSVTIFGSNRPATGGQSIGTMDRQVLERLVPEGLDATRWQAFDEEQARAETRRIDRSIGFLRGADFQDLASAAEFVLEENGNQTSFTDIVDETMKSELAKDLVKRGYVDRNFALYAAQFYGHFTGIDVANFMVQTVQTNTMDIDYKFHTPRALDNLLAETGEDFTRTISAYNIDVLDYLLESGHDGAEDIVRRILKNFDRASEEFLRAYLNAGVQQPALVEKLSVHRWPKTFTYIIDDENVPADVRPALVDAALRKADPEGDYELGEDVAKYIVEQYSNMSAITEPLKESEAQSVAILLDRAKVLIPELENVSKALRVSLVERNLYHLTADNLRVALETDADVGLDQVRAVDAVYRYCLDNPSTYLSAIEQDVRTEHSASTAQSLSEVLVDVADVWSPPLVQRLLAMAAPASCLPRLIDVPTSTWPALATAGLFHASIANLESYRSEIGEIDGPLAELLIEAGSISPAPPDAHELNVEAAIALLNAGDVIEEPGSRVDLVLSLDLSDSLPVERIEPEKSNLFALLLEHGLVADEAASFRHFHAGGWTAIEPAIKSSEHFEEFLAPDLVEGMVAYLFGSPHVNSRVGEQVIAALNEFVPEDDEAALMAVANFAVGRGIPLPLDQVQRVAATGEDTSALTLRLLLIAGPDPTPEAIVTTLAELGTPYSYLSTRTKTKFEVPYDDAHDRIFRRLKDAGVCDCKKKRNKSILTVELR